MMESIILLTIVKRLFMKTFSQKSYFQIMLIIAILASFCLISSSSSIDINIGEKNQLSNVDTVSSTNHTVLVEIASSQGCSGCYDWNNEIITEYENNSFDFEFVEMIVYDYSWDVLNIGAYQWKELFGITSYPTSIFDGGYKQLVGSNPDTLPSILASCEERTVNDIDAQLNVFWISSTIMNISIQITNNELETYHGSIKVPITEIISRYNTSYDEPFHNGFLDYVFNTNITIEPGQTYQDYVLWDGKNHQDAQENDYGDINQNNVKVLLSVFDSKGFSDETVTWATQEDNNQSFFNRGFPIRHAVDGDWAGAQNFSSTKNVISSAKLFLRKFGTPEFNLSVQLRENSVNGSIIESESYTPDEIQSTWDWVEFDFTDVVTSPEIDYFIIIPSAPSGVESSFGYEWGYAIGNLYADGSFWFTRDGGTLWRDLPAMYEFSFRTYGYN